MIETTISVNGITIRLPDERWMHIIDEHPELQKHKEEVLQTITKPDVIYEGTDKELFAVKECEPQKNIIVIYKEFEADGFIITAFFSRRKRFLDRRKKIWERQT